jgi:hypothetical protein
MAPGPDLKDEAAALDAVKPQGFQVGLHVTLTGGLLPLTSFRGGAYPGLSRLMMEAYLKRLDLDAVLAEVEAQFEAFREAFGRPPDFVDGHQHAHLLPGVRTIVLTRLKAHAPGAWIRQCAGSGVGATGRIIAGLSRGMVALASASGFATNPDFSGSYSFGGNKPFATLFLTFLEGLADGGLVMVHPGLVDAALKRVDPVHAPREAEYRYLMGDAFPADLARAGFALG